jgi:hypothetical protein
MSAYAEKIRKQQQRRYFRVADLEVEQEITLTISSLEEDEIVFENDKPVDLLYFQEDSRYLQMNVTNAKTLMTLYGDEPSAWAGKRIVLFLTTYETRGGEYKPCIRLREPGTARPENVVTVKPSPSPVRDDMDDEIPF